MSILTLTDLLKGGIGALGVLGIWIGLMVADKIHSDGSYQSLAERLKVADKTCEELRAALAVNQQALIDANSRADAAVRASELIAQAISPHARGRDDMS